MCSFITGHTDLNTGTRGLDITPEGQLIVVEADKHCITIINTNNGEQIYHFGERGLGQGQFSYPRGVALTQDGRVVVADWYNHRLQVFTVEGAFICFAGSEGSQPLQFLRPFAIAIHQNGKLFVTDVDNYRVQVLNPDLTYSHSFGKKGNLAGEFDEPRGIAIDSDGMVYVADWLNYRVQKFTPEGEVLAVIYAAPAGYSVRKFDDPVGVHISNDILYVAEWRSSSSVCIFTTSGQFLGYVGGGSRFKYPTFITSDQSGRLYISDDNGVNICKCYQ